MCGKKIYPKGAKKYYIHRFVWECFHRLIPDGKVIDHINNNKEDNRLCNLQLITQVRNQHKNVIIHLLLKITKIKSV